MEHKFWDNGLPCTEEISAVKQQYKERPFSEYLPRMITFAL